jgi:RNA polymerase sigma-70 factor, ECF subfamily
MKPAGTRPDGGPVPPVERQTVRRPSRVGVAQASGATLEECGTLPRVGLGSEAEVRAAYAAHAGELYGVALRGLADRGLAEEAVQETFLRAWRAADRFDPELATLRTWLFAILRNVVTDLHRRRAARPALAAIEDVEYQQGAAAADDIDTAILGWQVQEALRGLSVQHRQVLVEIRLRGRSQAEVAHELGLPVGTIKSRVHFALRALRLALEEQGVTL